MILAKEFFTLSFIHGKYVVPELPGIGQELTNAAYENADRVVIK